MEIKQDFITEPTNYGKANGNKPKYIVLHDTGNNNQSADADNHASWLNTSPNTGRSAHIFVDENQAIQIIPFTTPAWHTGKLYVASLQVPDCTNFNSIGIEFCVNRGSNLSQTLSNTKEVVAQLMKQFAIPIECVITHQMSSGKSCPNTFISNPSLYNQFMKDLKAFAVQPKADDEEVLKALAYLKEKGVINTSNYWLSKIEEVQYLKELIFNMVQALQNCERK